MLSNCIKHGLVEQKLLKSSSGFVREYLVDAAMNGSPLPEQMHPRRHATSGLTRFPHSSV